MAEEPKIVEVKEEETKEEETKVEETKEEEKVEETKEEEAKVAEGDDGDDSDDDIPPLESAEPEGDASAAGEEEEESTAGAKGKQSRSEKKARRAIAKLRMKPVSGVVRVTVKTARDTFVISQPDVFKSGGGDTYVVFGQARSDDFSSKQLKDFSKKFAKAEGEEGEGSDDEPPSLEPVEEEEEEVDETGVSEENINLVISQTEGVSRAEAVKALKRNNNDIVTSIMELSS